MRKKAQNILGEIIPESINQWHPTKNSGITPFDISYGSNKLVWWKCPKGVDHE